METKNLYVLVGSNGDGSYHTRYVIDDLVIENLQQAYDEGQMDYEYGIGVDGDGFHYNTLIIPEWYTGDMLGLSVYALITMENVSEYIGEERG